MGVSLHQGCMNRKSVSEMTHFVSILSNLNSFSTEKLTWFVKIDILYAVNV